MEQTERYDRMLEHADLASELMIKADQIIATAKKEALLSSLYEEEVRFLMDLAQANAATAVALKAVSS